jgi:hypothetical protein
MDILHIVSMSTKDKGEDAIHSSAIVPKGLVAAHASRHAHHFEQHGYFRDAGR